jgi:hypothetical protein
MAAGGGMADEDGGSKKSGLHRIAEWIGGLTAIVLALVGLKVALGELVKGSVFDGSATNMAANGGDDGYRDVLVNDSAPEGAMTNMDVVTNASDSDVAPTPTPTPTSIQEPEPEATMLPIEEGPPLPISYSKPNGVLRKLDDGGWEETDTVAGIRVNRRPKRTPYRRAKGTPFVDQCDGMTGAPFALVGA